MYKKAESLNNFFLITGGISIFLGFGSILIGSANFWWFALYFIFVAIITSVLKKFRDPKIVNKEEHAELEKKNKKAERKDQAKKTNPIETIQTTVPTQTDKKAGLFSSSTYCPHCRSLNVSFMQNNKKGFSVGKAVGGAALTGGIGTLAGFAGKKGKNQWHCQNCGKTFETKK